MDSFIAVLVKCYITEKGTLLMMELPNVTSSVYCSSSLTEMPLESVVSFMPVNFDNFL